MSASLASATTKSPGVYRPAVIAPSLRSRRRCWRPTPPAGSGMVIGQPLMWVRGSAAVSTTGPPSPFADSDEDLHVLSRRRQLEGLGDLSERSGGGDEVRGPDATLREQAGRFGVVLGQVGGTALDADLVVLHNRQRDAD